MCVFLRDSISDPCIKKIHRKFSILLKPEKNTLFLSIKTQLLFFPITTMAQEWTVSAPSCRLCMKAMLTEVECSACQEWCCLECVGHKDVTEAEKVRVMCGECSGLQERLKAQFAHIFRSVSPQRLMRTPASVLTTPERSIKHVTGIKNYNAKPFVIVLRRKL